MDWCLTPNAHALFFVQRGLNLQNSTFHPQSTFMCFVWTSIVITEMQRVSCAVRNGSLREVQVTLLLEGTSRLRKNFTVYTGSKRNKAVAYLFNTACTPQKTLAALANRPVYRHHQTACNSTQPGRSAPGKYLGREYQLVYRIK